MKFYIPVSLRESETPEFVIKGDRETAIAIAQKIARQIDQDPNYLERHPEHSKFRNSDPEINRKKEREEKEEHEFTEYDTPMESKSACGQTDSENDHLLVRERNQKSGEAGYTENFTKRLNARLDPSPIDAQLTNNEGVCKGKDGQVAAIGVMDGDKILMGKRRDNGRWTNPGGHLEEGEKPHDGAKRELFEEAGLEHDKLKKLAKKKVVTPTGKELTIHAFVVEHDGQKVSAKHDPDHEVEKWQWVATKDGLPEEVASNLHSPKNVVLQKLGLIKSFYISDLMKAGPHKYLRKYMRGGKWIYIYHESHETPGRQIPEEAFHAIRGAAETGHEHARALLETLQEHHPEKLEALRALADQGHEESKKHLKHLGIDRESEKLEEKLIPRQVRAKDQIDEELVGADHAKAEDAIRPAVDKMFGRWRGNPGSVFEQKATAAGITVASIMNAVSGKKNLRGMLQALHGEMKKIDVAHTGLAQPSFEEAKSAGGYGNMVYNAAITNLERDHLLPEGYSKAHKRTVENRAGDLKPHGFKEHEAKVAEAKAKAERELAEKHERERRELAEVHGSMAHFMSTIAGHSMSTSDVKRLHQSIKSIFGKDLRKEDWPYDFSGSGLKTKITSVDFGGNSISLEMQVFDADGHPMMRGWSRRWTKEGSRPHIENAYMVVNSDARGSVQVGNLINQGQRKLMRSLPNGGTVGVHANIDVGGYTWANQGFTFDSPSMLNNFRQRFKRFAGENGINLSDSDLDKFTEPCHFAAFNTGKKVVKNIRDAMPLSEQQIQTKSLSGVPGEHPLTAEELRSKKAGRMACHIGKAFMLGTDWYGTWDSKRNTEASKFADQYYQLRDRAAEHLSPDYRGIMQAAASGARAGRVAAEETRPVTSRASLNAGVERAQRHIEYWRPRGRMGRSNITMSAGRMARVKTWTTPEIQHLITNAPLTPNARSQLRKIVLERGGR